MLVAAMIRLELSLEFCCRYEAEDQALYNLGQDARERYRPFLLIS